MGLVSFFDVALHDILLSQSRKYFLEQMTLINAQLIEKNILKEKLSTFLSQIGNTFLQHPLLFLTFIKHMNDSTETTHAICKSHRTESTLEAVVTVQTNTEKLEKWSKSNTMKWKKKKKGSS